MEATLLAIALVAIGVYYTIRNIRMLRRHDLLREYVQSSPKAALWVRKYGVDGATKLIRETFLPLGTALSAGFALYGLWLLWRVYG